MSLKESYENFLEVLLDDLNSMTFNKCLEHEKFNLIKGGLESLISLKEAKDWVKAYANNAYEAIFEDVCE